ncbi:prepilin peptidase [Rhodovulum euryhalinum]|nr:prepilin peptidase [Rhodovulum euryhalinum]
MSADSPRHGARALTILAGGMALAILAALAALALSLGRPLGAVAFLPFVLPVAFWVARSDMKTMKIPNRAVLALVAVFAAVGLVALPVEVWAWRWTHLAAILVLGFVMSSLRLIGAGDAKFAAAMAPFVALADIGSFLFLFSGVTLAAFAGHRLARRIPAVRRALPGWDSWERSDFPMGIALAGVLVAYLALSAAGLMASST